MILSKIDLYYKKCLLRTCPIFNIFLVLTLISLITYITLDVKTKQNLINSELDTSSLKINNKFHNIIDHTEYIMNMINLQIQKFPKNKEYINNILKKFKTNPNLTNQLSWTLFTWANDKDFLIVDALYEIMDPPFDISSRDYIEFTKASPGKFQIGQPVMGSTSDKWMIAGGVGLNDKNDNYLGTMTIGFDLEILLPKLREILYGTNTEMILLDKNLNVITQEKSIKYEYCNFISKNQKLQNQLKYLINNTQIPQITNVSLLQPNNSYKTSSVVS